MIHPTSRPGPGRPGGIEQSVLAKVTAQLARDGRCGKSSQLVVQVGLEERTAGNARLLGGLERPLQGRFIGDTADDEIRMMGMAGLERSRGLDDGVTGLHELLGGRQVLADQDVDIGNLVSHDNLLLVLPLTGIEPALTGV